VGPLGMGDHVPTSAGSAVAVEAGAFVVEAATLPCPPPQPVTKASAPHANGLDFIWSGRLHGEGDARRPESSQFTSPDTLRRDPRFKQSRRTLRNPK
jgi:hypothetical protein